jgi:hypothetical protein
METYFTHPLVAKPSLDAAQGRRQRPRRPRMLVERFPFKLNRKALYFLSSDRIF